MLRQIITAVRPVTTAGRTPWLLAFVMTPLGGHFVILPDALRKPPGPAGHTQSFREERDMRRPTAFAALLGLLTLTVCADDAGHTGLCPTSAGRHPGHGQRSDRRRAAGRHRDSHQQEHRRGAHHDYQRGRHLPPPEPRSRHLRRARPALRLRSERQRRRRRLDWCVGRRQPRDEGRRGDRNRAGLGRVAGHPDREGRSLLGCRAATDRGPADCRTQSADARHAAGGDSRSAGRDGLPRPGAGNGFQRQRSAERRQ